MTAIDDPAYRPLPILSYLFNYAVLGNGKKPAGYHALTAQAENGGGGRAMPNLHRERPGVQIAGRLPAGHHDLHISASWNPARSEADAGL